MFVYIIHTSFHLWNLTSSEEWKRISSHCNLYFSKKIVIFFSSNVYERCGIVAVLLNEIQRMNYENGHINIVEIVKLMRATSKNIIKSYVRDKLSTLNLSFQHQHAVLTQYFHIVYILLCRFVKYNASSQISVWNNTNLAVFYIFLKQCGVLFLSDYNSYLTYCIRFVKKTCYW